MIKIITGDLLSANEKYIVHQANCLSHYASGIAAAIYDKFPYSNIYVNRHSPDKPGTIIISGNGQDERYVVNLMGQYYPGGPRKDFIDDKEARQKYFHRALIKLAKVPNLDSVAFPFNIGCGLAKGNWEDYYYPMINNFAKFIYDEQNAITKIYQLDVII